MKRLKKQQPAKILKFSKEKLKKELLQEARAINIQPGAAEDLASRIVTEVETWAKTHTAITQKDLNSAVARSAKKYHADLAYVYQNRGKIV